MTRLIRVKRERVFAALTERVRLREWLCDRAWSDPRPGGRLLLHWDSGCQVLGTVLGVEQPKQVVWIWHGQGEPGPTLVEWILREAPDGTEVSLVQRGFGPGAHWKETFTQAERGWNDALENLQSLLETGIDLRQARRPFLGVMLEDLRPEAGAVVERGIVVSGVIAGGAAEAAGLQEGDILIGLAGQEVGEFAGLVRVLQGLRAGDTVAARLVRGREERTVQVTLQAPKRPDVPDDPAEAATQLRQEQTCLQAELAEAIAGLSEEEAGRRPAEGEWSVKETLAHLSIAERGMQEYAAQLAVGLEVEDTANPTVWPERLAAVLAAAPTVEALLARLEQDQEEMALLIERLSEDTRADRYRYRQIVQLALSYGVHVRDHIGQIRRAVAAIRSEE